jgi:phage gpG-like protein
MPTFRVDFDTVEVRRELATLSVKASNVSMWRVGVVLSTAIDDLIQNQGEGGEQGKWPDFSPETLRRNPKRRGGMLLQDTGLLAQMQVDAKGHSVVVSSPAPYAHWHADGTRRMPRRDFLAIDLNESLKEIVDLITEQIVG